MLYAPFGILFYKSGQLTRHVDVLVHVLTRPFEPQRGRSALYDARRGGMQVKLVLYSETIKRW